MRAASWSNHLTNRIKLHANERWYPIAVGILAFTDHFVFFIPIDALLIASSALAPHKKTAFALSISLGSALGAYALSLLIAELGTPLVLETFPEIAASAMWEEFRNFLDSSGKFGLALIAASPFALQPAVVLAGIAEMSPESVFLASFVGRVLKSCFLNCFIRS